MKIPSRDSFSPLPEVCSYLGLSDPTEHLAELENQLELVPDAKAALDDIMSGIEEAAESLSTGSADIKWEGKAAEGFSTKLDLGVDTLGDLATSVQELAAVFDFSPKEFTDFIQKLLGYLTALCVIAAAIIGLLVTAEIIAATGLVAFIGAVLALIAGILGFLMLLLTDLPELGYLIYLWIKGQIDILKDLCDGPDTPAIPDGD